MSENMHRKFGVFLKRTRTTEGKITIFTSLVACLVLVCVFTMFQFNVPVASADDVVTSVTVLNTPPTFDTDVAESPASATTTPTNAGAVLSFTVQATDSSGDNYYLLICKTSGAPTANSGAAPTCAGGISNQWAVSSATLSGTIATSSTTTVNYFPFDNESNDWYGFVCDNNASLARCNSTANIGTPGQTSASPFVINHVPLFITVSNTGTTTPGSTVAWSTTASDTDTLGTADTLTLVVCKLPDFTGTSCGPGGAWATSTSVTTNPGTTTPIVIPTQDRYYNAYTYVFDNHNLAATSTNQGSNSYYVISNVAPQIFAAQINIFDSNDVSSSITLATPSATSGPYRVKFTVVDNNGCLNASSTSEIASNIMAVYRSGVTQASCNSAANYNSNNCYAATSTLFTPFYTCAADAAVNACSGATDSDMGFTCTFSLWYNSDPTDASTQFTAQNWLASVRATDDNATTSAFVESSSGVDLLSFLAFDVSTTTVAYGSLQPGDTTTPLVANTDLIAIGNIGLDEDVYGSTMCTTWVGGGGGAAPDNCDTGGPNAATKIPVTQQVVATGTVAYTTAAASSTITGALSASTTPRALLINVPKTTATSSPQTRNTYWGIAIPSTITLAGSYSGQNTITAKKSAFANW